MDANNNKEISTSIIKKMLDYLDLELKSIAVERYKDDKLMELVLAEKNPKRCGEKYIWFGASNIPNDNRDSMERIYYYVDDDIKLDHGDLCCVLLNYIKHHKFFYIHLLDFKKNSDMIIFKIPEFDDMTELKIKLDMII